MASFHSPSPDGGATLGASSAFCAAASALGAAASADAPMLPAVRDALWQGRLPLWQPARKDGYRFNLDSVLLAGFVDAGPHRHVMDLGAGCGIIGLMLLASGKAQTLTSVERQPALAGLIRRNFALYGLGPRARLIAGDLRTAALPRANRVVFNPPYFPRASSRANAHPGRDAGRRELHGTLADFVARAAAHLTCDGELCAIVPYARAQEVQAACARAGLRLRRRRRVQRAVNAPPRHALLAAGAIFAGEAADEVAPAWLPPLVVHDPARASGYAAEVEALIAGPAAWPGPPGGGADRSPSGG